MRKRCLKCEEEVLLKNFYSSNSGNHSDKKYPVCKTCLKQGMDLSDPYSDDCLEKLQNILLEMNRPFIFSLWTSSVEESNNTGKELFGVYLKNVLLNFKTLTWKESEFNSYSEVTVEKKNSKVTANQVSEDTTLSEENASVIEYENKNKDDVLRMLGYDPFEYEHKDDKRHLYNKLVDFLDESALEDGFKLQAVIEIVKGFNQIDKINRAITSLTNDVLRMTTNSGGIKSLIESKQKILTSLLKLAEDNGISVKHNNQKSKGAGTLTGIIKTLQEKGFEEGEVNLYDVETAQGMRQVADLSNKSIVAQLQFDENDYTEMLMEQRDIIHELDSKATKLEEENRLLKKEIMKLRKQEVETNE